MGAEVILGAAALAIGAASAGVGASMNSRAVDKANELSMQEAERNRQFQAQQVAQQNARQEEMYQKYQSPEAVARQLKNIGVNPASYFGSGKGSMTPGMPSVASPATGSQANIQANTQNGALVASAMKDASQGIESLSRAARTKEERLKLKREADKILAEKYGQDLINNHQAIVNMVDSWSLSEKAKAEISDLLYSASLKASQADYNGAQVDYTRLLQKIGSEDLKIKKEEAVNAPLLFARQVELLGAKIDTEVTQQESNKASASQSRALAALAISQKEEQSYKNIIARVESENTEKAQIDLLNELLTDLHSKASQNRQKKLAADIQIFRDQLNDPRLKSSGRQRVDAALDWLRQKFGFGVSSNISIK